MTVIVMLYVLAIFAVPFLLLLVLPVAATIVMKRRGHGWPVSLLPLLVPVAVLVSEAFPKWYVRSVAEAPLTGFNRDIVDNVYANGTSEDAARLLVRHPALGFAEGVQDSMNHGPMWSDMKAIPEGLVRFRGRRSVSGRDDCGLGEVVVRAEGMGDSDGDNGPHWYCTGWETVPRLTADFELRHVIGRRRVGPYVIREEIDEVVRRDTGQRVRAVVSASMSAGIIGQWQAITDFLGPTEGRYDHDAATLGDAGRLCQEAFLLTGKITASGSAPECQIR